VEADMPNTKWSELNPLQLGRYAEYYAKMELASYGLEIYTSEVDDHGIDFIAKIYSMPECFLVPSTEWGKTDALLCYRTYDGKKSEPEYGINLSKKNMPILDKYKISSMIVGIK
jgi:hypothetical protein